MRARAASVAGLAVGLVLAAGTFAAPISGQHGADFGSWITAEMKTHGIPGVSIAVVDDYAIQWAAGFGLADTGTGRPVTIDTPFQVASVSKPIAAIAIIESYFDHGVALDAPIAPIVFPNGDTWTLPNPYPEQVTARQILSHTAGVASFHYSGFQTGVVLPDLEQELKGEAPATTPPVTVVTRPGTMWSYAPAGYTVLQAEVEQQNGWQPFPELMDRYLLDKIPELRSSSFAAPPDPALAERMAVPYLPDGSALPGGPRVFNTSAAGSMVSTPSDIAMIMIAFQRALAGMPSPIPAEVANAMMVRQAGQIPGGHCMPTAESGAVACKAPWGLGFDVNLGSTFMNHIPDDMPTGNWFGHSGFNSGYLCFMLANKTDGDGLVIMVNSAPADMATSDIPELPFITNVINRIAADQGWHD